MVADEEIRMVDCSLRAILKKADSGGTANSGIKAYVGAPTDNNIRKRLRSWSQSVPSDENEVFSENNEKDRICFCRQPCSNEMISCENDGCPIRWYHFKCVKVDKIPRKGWFCPICSNKRMKF